MEIKPRGFTKYLVIFVDILGSKSRTDFEETYKINEIYHQELENNQQRDVLHTPYFRKIFSFSDCAYIFYGYKDGIDEESKDIGKLLTVALCNCESLFLKFLKEKIIFRGGIYYGNAYMDSHRNMFFGEAVNKAYEFESKIAVHPRVVVDKFVAKIVGEHLQKVKLLILSEEVVGLIGMGLVPELPETGDGIIEKDIDGEYIFNYLHLPENNIRYFSCYQDGEEFIKELISFCNEQIESLEDYKTIDKYFYLKRFAKAKLDMSIEHVY